MMMKNLKLTILLTVFMSMMGTRVFGQDFEAKNADGVTIYYLKTSGTEVAVTGQKYRRGYGTIPNTYSGDIVIPESVTYGGITYKVTRIGGEAFYGSSRVTSVTIPNSVNRISKAAFSGCTGLTSVSIPNSVTEIGEIAFSGCTGLTTITIPNSMTSIGNRAFEDCKGLTSVTIPNSVTTIGFRAFYGCSRLTSVTIPNSVTYIDGKAFEQCTGLTSVTIPNSVTRIDIDAFMGCWNLTAITIPNSVTFIGNGAFNGCTGLTTVTFHCKVIGSWFNGLTSIKKVVMGNEVKEIGLSAFDGCSGLTAVTIPNNVTRIAAYAFRNCNLTAVTVPASVKEMDKGCFAYNKPVKSASVPGKIKPGTEEYFIGCSNLKAVTVRTGKAVRRSTDVAWFGNPTSSSHTEVYGADKIDPNSMSWPRPTYDSGWDRSDRKYRELQWGGVYSKITITRVYHDDGSVSYLVASESYNNYNDAEAAAYFWSVHHLMRTHGKNRRF